LVGSLLATSDGSVAVPTNPQPQPNAEGKLLWWANDGEHPDARIWLTQDECRALLASLATLREERDALHERLAQCGMGGG
jgi:hypothetical protein